MNRHNKELRTNTPSQLRILLEQARGDLATLKFQLANRQSSNTARLSTLRHEIARIKTLLREDELRRTS
jgi:large subunit ribosomal protein L29